MRSTVWALAVISAASLGTSVRGDDSNQSLADRIAGEIQSSGVVKGYHLDIEAAAGIVELSGDVANHQDREDLIDLVRSQSGVLAVRDRIAVRDAATQPASDLQQVADTSIVTEGSELAGGVIEPEPVMDYQGGIAPYSDSPIVPPYAWPSYTPYNNYASMAYQTQYPSGAWPFIGPPHPYPMIPSGWRRVSLTWKKGYWWMRFHAH